MDFNDFNDIVGAGERSILIEEEVKLKLKAALRKEGRNIKFFFF